MRRTVVAMLLFLAFCLLVGVAFAFLGFRLFLEGIDSQSDLEAGFGNARLVASSFAPGTFFALFGTVIACLSLWQGLNSLAGRAMAAGF